MHRRHLATWLLALSMLLLTVQADQLEPQKCLEYCLMCEDNGMYNNLNVSMGWPLEVSLQVGANGALLTQIFLEESEPSTHIAVNEEKAMLLVKDAQRKQLTLADPKPFSWITLVLAPAGPNTVLAYLPKDRKNVMTANFTVHGSLVRVAVKDETHVVFNCLSGCLIRNTSSGLVDGGEAAKLQPPFTMYLKPRLRQNHSITPALILAADRAPNSVPVNASEWEPDVWHRVRVLVSLNDQEQNTVSEPQEARDGVMETQVWVTNGSYTITKLEGLSWTLHCIPEGLLNVSASTASPDPENGTEAAFPSTEATEDEGNKSKQKTEGSAGAGQVTAWVMAGLALFLVMVLALALCTKTARRAQPQHVQDSQPSVGIVYWKGATREPDEDSEPESPDELKVPSFHNSLKQPGITYKIVEE